MVEETKSYAENRASERSLGELKTRYIFPITRLNETVQFSETRGYDLLGPLMISDALLMERNRLAKLASTPVTRAAIQALDHSETVVRKLDETGMLDDRMSWSVFRLAAEKQPIVQEQTNLRNQASEEVPTSHVKALALLGSLQEKLQFIGSGTQRILENSSEDKLTTHERSQAAERSVALIGASVIFGESARQLEPAINNKGILATMSLHDYPRPTLTILFGNEKTG